MWFIVDSKSFCCDKGLLNSIFNHERMIEAALILSVD